MKNYKTVGVITILIGIGFFLIYSYISGGKSELTKNDDDDSIFVEDNIDMEEEEVQVDENKIVVEIKGEVNNPNVYWVSEDSIVEDLINLAGGITQDGDLSQINRAEKLIDHESIVIPNKNDLNSQDNLSTENNVLGNDSLVNINTATEEELETLPGVGPAKAGEIISYREENGGFKAIEELKNVSGIGDASFEKLKDKIRI